MISRNLTRRLKKLEGRNAPAAEPVIVEVMFVSPDGTEEMAFTVELPTSAEPAWLRRIREQRESAGHLQRRATGWRA
jgi:hypothetical protein